MSARLDTLQSVVATLYAKKNPERDNWSDWMYDNHVRLVSDTTLELCKKYDADPDIACAAALLHDIADTVVSRFASDHKERSAIIAHEALTSAYSPEEIIIIEDILETHSCRDGHTPTSLEGKIMATSDALVHLKTDFYVHALWSHGATKTLEEAKNFALGKIERDLNQKIFFDEEKSTSQHHYEILREVFSR